MFEWLLAFLVAGSQPAPPAEPAPTMADKPVALVAPPPAVSELDRIAVAVEGVESGHGRDKLMWNPDWRGPQGPMQVTHEAALDVGGGNRFDLAENRLVGRAYLAGMFRRYGNWVDAVAAYNWGPGNLDRWIAAGRPPAALSAPVQAYIARVMRDFIGDDRPAPTRPAAPAATRAVWPPPPSVPEPSPPRDPHLLKRFERNTEEIKQLRAFIAGDDGSEAAARSAIREAAIRRGYEEFQALRATPRPVSTAALREIALALLDRLQRENAALALVDEHRRRAPR